MSNVLGEEIKQRSLDVPVGMNSYVPKFKMITLIDDGFSKYISSEINSKQNFKNALKNYFCEKSFNIVTAQGRKTRRQFLNNSAYYIGRC